jgi:hypothetical protein
MNTIVIVTGAIGLVGSYVLGLLFYGNLVRQKQLRELALLFRENQEKFNLYFYNIAIDITKQEIAARQEDDIED